MTEESPDAGAQAGAEAEGTLADAIKTVTSRLAELSGTDTELARACAVVGRWLLELSTPQTSEAVRAPQAEQPEAPRVDRVLSLGGSSVPVSVADGGSAVPVPQEEPGPAPSPTGPATQEEVALSTVVSRARLKAECCRWAITRRKRMEDEVDFDQHIKPRDRDLIARAKALPNCYVWPLDPYASSPQDRVLDDAAGCYESLADAVELADRIGRDAELSERYGPRVYELVAECCSALRVILLEPDIVNDADQADTFNWLRDRVSREQVYISRHMRLDDPADPACWPARQAEIARIIKTIDADHARLREIRNLLGRIDYIAKRWDDYDADERRRQACKLDEAVRRLAELSVRTSDPRIRDPLLTIADELPESVVPGGAFAEALRYADEYAARREVESRPATAGPSEPAPEVTTARRLIEGKTAVLIGGHCRPHSRDALQQALGLREVRWVSTRPHESVDGLAAEVRRKDVDLVMLAIRWSSHSFDEIKQVCGAAGKVYVRLPRGYGVNQVAREIVAQVSDELAKRGSA